MGLFGNRVVMGGEVWDDLGFGELLWEVKEMGVGG